MKRKTMIFSEDVVRNIVKSMLDSQPAIKSYDENSILVDTNAATVTVSVSYLKDINIFNVAIQTQNYIYYRLREQMDDVNIKVNIIVK